VQKWGCLCTEQHGQYPHRLRARESHQPPPCVTRSSQHRKQPWVCRVNWVLSGSFLVGERWGRRGRLDTPQVRAGKSPRSLAGTRGERGRTQGNGYRQTPPLQANTAPAKVPMQLAFAKRIRFKLVVALQNSTSGKYLPSRQSWKGDVGGVPGVPCPFPSHRAWSSPGAWAKPVLGTRTVNKGKHKASSEGRGDWAELRPEGMATATHCHPCCLHGLSPGWLQSIISS